ncbi:KilA-N domain-containing protein [Chromobacterium sp. ASV23]|uniref:KilA-N domain-containing protein n=1 Tax=Chromobacterium sp. ASV23 TaxID=2795110 RepID=UPI0018EC14AB|nr:KilA-N domain-containing protein [Chromobacterium sp. ASV23]
MTKAVKAYGKQMVNFWHAKDTRPYMAELASSLKINEEGHTCSLAGSHRDTWAHPKLAVFFARWLDVKFAVWLCCV